MNNLIGYHLAYAYDCTALGVRGGDSTLDGKKHEDFSSSKLKIIINSVLYLPAIYFLQYHVSSRNNRSRGASITKGPLKGGFLQMKESKEH